MRAHTLAGAVWVLLLGTSGCSHAITLPPELERAERLPVEAPGGLLAARQIRFGVHVAEDIQRSWTRGRGLSGNVGRRGGSHSEARATYQFRFSAGGGSTEHVECEATASRQALGVGPVEVEAAANYGVLCTTGDADGWRLTLQANRNAQPKGSLRSADGTWDVVGVGSGGGVMISSTHGFEIRQGERAVAAVQKGAPASVWFAADVAESDRATLGAAAAALLLLQRIHPE